MEYKLISGSELENNLKKYFIIDTRSKGEYELGHVPGSINIPFDQVLENIEIIDKNMPLVLYCGSNSRSKFAADILAHAGYKDITIAPGVRLYDYNLIK